MTTPVSAKGPIAWMARHGVAPNLLMILMVVGGLVFATKITQEVFPSYDLDQVRVTVVLPGATPEETETAIVLPIEGALESIAGIDEMESSAREGLGTFTLTLSSDSDRRALYDEIRQAVEGITSFPEEAELPTFALSVRKREVMSLQVFGAADPMSIRMAAERVRERLLEEEGVTQVDMPSALPMRITVEIAEARLRALGLTLAEVAQTLRGASRDLGGGSIEARGGDLLLRLADRRESVDEFARIPILADRTGTVVRLGDIATLTRGVEDRDFDETYDGLPAFQIKIQRVGDQTPVGVSDAVRSALPAVLETLPEAIDVAITSDRSEIFRERMDLLLWNGFIGLALVLTLLSLFLEFKLAFWVAVGIPTAFLGSFLLLGPGGASINMVTMFAFIVALGIVVDDAIVVGENIYEYRRRGMAALDAAIQGARDISVPLAFSILTNIVAFLPLAMMPGGFGKFFFWIPAVVAAVFLLSWIEALFVLPAHLAAVKRRDPKRRIGAMKRLQLTLANGLDSVVSRIYAPVLSRALDWRYATVALAGALLLVVLAMPLSGRMGFNLFPTIPRDTASVTVRFPVDIPHETVAAARDQYLAAAERVLAENGGEQLGTGIQSRVQGSTLTLWIYLQPPDIRPLSTSEVVKKWRQAAGPVPAARSSNFRASFGGPGAGAGITVVLYHRDTDALREASTALLARLAEFPSITDPEDGFTPGKAQLSFRLTETGRALGLTSDEVGRQVRAAFQGIEALSLQDGRNEVDLMVRLPLSERRSEADIETLLIRTPDGGEVALYEVATVERGRAASQINRNDGRRTILVEATVDPPEQAGRITAALETDIMPALARDIPGLAYEFGGRQKTRADTIGSFVEVSIPITLILIYGLLAIPFRSYVQPAIVMLTIPFGIVGAVIGHLIMGMAMSLPSVFGMIALAGVVINAAIVMIDHANRLRRAGASAREAAFRAGQRRFRPIVLTTVTTFCGLAPMIFETSRQAQFLIPMAVSLGYGIVFATAVALFLIPALYTILDDLRWLANPPEPAPPRRKPLRLTGDDIVTPPRMAAE